MPKKCPPGVICIESMTGLIILCALGYIIYQNIYIPMKNNFPITRTNSSTTQHIVYAPQTQQVPITVQTQRGDSHYTQVGILTRNGGSSIILPLYGRMVNSSRSKWQYYTLNDSNNHVRLPINVKGRNASDEYGVDELYNGDSVYVQGYNEIFSVTIYENNRFTYNPF